MTRGGKRENAGKKKGDLDDLKVKRTFSLDPDISEWINGRTSNYSQFVGDILRQEMNHLPKIKKMTRKQVVISVLSNAGGAGKTTAIRNLAYEMSRAGLKVALIDLDPQHNLDLFCGFALANSVEGTIVDMLTEKSQADWNLTPVKNESIDVCRGHLAMAELQNELVPRRRSEHVLSQKLIDNPLPHDVILLDCPATLGKICENAIVASDHILISLGLEDKFLTGFDGLIKWLQVLNKDLSLNPAPSILGILPNAYDKTVGTHRACLEQLIGTEAYNKKMELPEASSGQLTGMVERMGLKFYETIDYSAEVMNANANGLAVATYRPGHKLTQQYRGLTTAILEDTHHG